MRNTVYFTKNHLWLTDLKFIALTPHGLNQNAEMQLATATDQPAVRRIRIFKPQSHIGEEFTLQAIANLATRDELTFLSSKRRIIDHKGHLQGRFIHLDQRESLWMIWASNGFANVDFIKTCQSNDVSSSGLIDFDSTQALKTKKFGDTSTFNGSVVTNQGNSLSVVNRAIMDSANDNTTQKVIIIQACDL